MMAGEDGAAPKPKSAPTEITMTAADLRNAWASDYGRLAELKYEGIKGLMDKIFDNSKHANLTFKAFSPPFLDLKSFFKLVSLS